MLTHEYTQFCLATRADVRLSQSFIQRINSVLLADALLATEDPPGRARQRPHASSLDEARIKRDRGELFATSIRDSYHRANASQIMYPPGFTMDYAVPAKLMGHDYYAIHNDSVFPESA